MRNHDGAGKVWDRAFQAGAIKQHSVLCHIDAHDDLAKRGILPCSFAELTKKNYQVGSFILPRVNVGIIDTIIWIKPKGEDPTNKLRRNTETASFVNFPSSLEAEDLRNKPLVHTTDKITPASADLLDIDLDFFTQGLSKFTPNFVLKRRVSAFMKELFNNISGVKIITIATSPGYIQSGREIIILETVLREYAKKKKRIFSPNNPEVFCGGKDA